MCDHQHGFALGKLGKSRLYFCFIVRVGKGGGLVQDQDGRIFQHGAGNGNALLLAAGQIHAFCANDGMDALRELFHDIHALCSFQRRQHLGFGGLRSAQTDVIQNAALEQTAVLEHKGDGIHQLFLGDSPHIRSAHPDAATLHIKEPADKVCQRGFSAAGGAHKSRRLPRLNRQRNALDDLGFSVIAEMHIPQRDRGILRVLRNSLHLHGHRLQHRVDACQRIRHHHPAPTARLHSAKRRAAFIPLSAICSYLRCILLLPGGSQIFQQRPAHHRAFRLGKRQPHFLFQLPDSIGQAWLRNIELLHCMADGAGAGNSRDIAELLKGHGSFLSACFFYPTAEPPKTQRIFFFEIPNEHCRHIQDTFYPPCNFPYNSTAVLKQLQHSHITKEAFRYGTTAK